MEDNTNVMSTMDSDLVDYRNNTNKEAQEEVKDIRILATTYMLYKVGKICYNGHISHFISL